jgi:hypothetical protein
MPEQTDFTVKVTSDDPKRKKEDQLNKDKKEGSSKLKGDAKDTKEGEGEELVRVNCVLDASILMKDPSYSLRRMSSCEMSSKCLWND